MNSLKKDYQDVLDPFTLGKNWFFLAFLRNMLKLIQPMLWLPPVSQALARLADIVGPLLGDTDEPTTNYGASPPGR